MMSRAQHDILLKQAERENRGEPCEKFSLEGKSAALMKREFDFYGLNIRMHESEKHRYIENAIIKEKEFELKQLETEMET